MADKDILKTIQDRWEYHRAQWKNVREEGRKDMLYLSGDPWEPEERKAREEANRPCLSTDELNQYVNQLVNGARQARRAVKVQPEGGGASDESAELRGGLIRKIEYKSRAPQAYLTALQCAAERSYGYIRVSRRYVSDSSFDQELVVKRVPNPDVISLDPDAQELDSSDGVDAFVVQKYSWDEFRRRWPKAKTTGFTNELFKDAPTWIGEKDLQVAEYWRKQVKQRELVLLDGGGYGPIQLFLDEAQPEHKALRVLKRRVVRAVKVVQFVTNGVEVMEENDWDGKYIPLIPVYGREMWVDTGSGSERRLLSLVRLARDPQMLLNYYRSAQVEIVGQVPKTPWIGAKGQFDGFEDDWLNVNRVPLGYLQYNPTLDSIGQHVLPPPQRAQWEPPIQAMEFGAEAARRAIQAAMGISALPTAAQRRSEKSGIALERIENQQERGSYHFIDAYESGIEHTGRVLDDLLDSTYDTEGRQVGILDQSDEQKVVTLNTREPYLEDGKPKQYTVRSGEHGITLSTSRSFQSQHEEASEFADTLMQIPELAGRVADLAIKAKQLGPLGDEMAKRVAPPDASKEGEMSPAQVQEVMKQHEALTQRVNELTAELDSKRQELESKERIAAEGNQTKILLEYIKQEGQANLEEFRQELAAVEKRLLAARQESEPETQPQEQELQP